MAVQPDIDTFVAPNKPFVVRLQSDTFETNVQAKLTLEVAGQSRAFRIGDNKQPTTDKADSHDVSVDPFFGTKVFFHDWGEANTGDDVVVAATSDGTRREDKGDVL